MLRVQPQDRGGKHFARYVYKGLGDPHAGRLFYNVKRSEEPPENFLIIADAEYILPILSNHT